MEKSRSHWTVLLLALPLAGCQFSASASGEAKSSGDASGDASASLTEEQAPPPKPPAPQGAIKFREGKLDYEGVINFEYDKADLRKDEETQKTLADFKSFLDQHPDVKIEIEGHTDSRGSDDYNRDLSDRRAASVRKWLTENGVAEARVTSVGKGEDSPQVPEPGECDDKEPADTAACEGPWGKNRRVVFQVTGGAETIKEEPPPPPPPPAPVAEAPPPAPAPAEECPWLWGGRINAFGPNSWVTFEGATQPGICWLELSVGVGIGLNSASAETMTEDADGEYGSLTVPLRGRFWFMDRHSIIGDLGIGFTHYWISADLEDAAGVDGSYERITTPLIGHLGLGYGLRPNGAQAGPRLALIFGGLMHLTDLGASSIDTDTGFANGAAIQGALDDETDELADLEPYGELSFGYLF